MKHTTRLLIIAMAILPLQFACGSKPATRLDVDLPEECTVVSSSQQWADSITVALFDAVQPEHAPWGQNSGEQMVFHHLYETLIDVDCRGDVQPGLAESWKKEEGGRRWKFTIRENARFWDGTPVTAPDVVNSWQQINVEPIILDVGVDSIAAVDDRTLILFFHYARRRVPRGLSSQLFAVAKPVEDVHWPLGTGPYRPGSPDGGEVLEPLRTGIIRPSEGEDGPVIKYLNASRTDARDLLERDVDMMVTADPAVIAYAATRPQLLTAALSWDKTYVLVPATRVRELMEGARFDEISRKFTDGLARDAVRGDARGYRSPSWWDDIEDCTELSEIFPWRFHLPRGAQSQAEGRRIIYDLDDPIARDLAERIVALASTGSDESSDAAAVERAVPDLVNDSLTVVAEGVGKDEFAFSLRDGQDFGYIIAIPRRPPDICDEARRLIHRVPWLAALKYDFCKALVPLVDTRRHVISKKQMGRLITDWYGNVHISAEVSQER